MKILKSFEDLNSINRQKNLAFVPTMGALHAGHLSLIEIARKHAQAVIVSIYVNPTQFGANEDLDQYPRPLDEDIKKLEESGVDYLFLPSTDLIYPNGEKLTHFANLALANQLCGLTRAGHFDGVCTVVYKLFDLIKPDFAVFGEKDYQQLLIIADMVKVESLDLKIISAPILRERDGLAMSSRNIYLDEKERLSAAEINKMLVAVTRNEKTIDEAKEHLKNIGFEIDYLQAMWGRLFFAGKIGTTRLIDNVGYA